MQSGLYRKIDGHSGVGELYEFDCLARDHVTGVHFVVYIPLRIEPNWTGPRHCVISREEFNRKFTWVAEGLVPGFTHEGSVYTCPYCGGTETTKAEAKFLSGASEYEFWCRPCNIGFNR